MRFLLSIALAALAAGAAIGSGASAMLSRNVLDVNGFTAVLVGTVQSPAGQQLVRTSVANTVADTAAAGGYDGLAIRAAAGVAGDWAAKAVQRPEAMRVLAPAAVGLQQGILTGSQTGVAEFDVRAFASALQPPPVVATTLAAIPGPLLIEVPWVRLSPGAQTVLQELDRHRWLPAGLALLAVALALLALMVARRRGLVLVVMGVLLAVAAWFLRPVASGYASSLVVGRSVDSTTGPLADEFVQRIFTGWSAVSGALIAIGIALVVVGVVFGVRRRT